MAAALMDRRSFLGLGTGAALSSFAALQGCGQGAENSGSRIDDTRPNIVLIMADDMGFSDIGCYGGEIDTPNIDKLAADGIRFTRFYNNAICVPTRASLLTGLYSQQVGVWANSPQKMEHCVTLAEVLRGAGYRTLMSGKWHALELPTDRGFDRYYGLADGGCNYFNPGLRRKGEPEPGRKRHPQPWPEDKRFFRDARRWAIEDKEYIPYSPEDPNFYTTDAFTDYALERLDEYAGEDKPFFLYLAYTSPHYPLHAWPEDIEKYRGSYLCGWDELREQRYERMRGMGIVDENWPLSPRDDIVPAWNDVPQGERDAWDLRMSVYAAMIDRMDQNIGKVLKKLEASGEMDNTLILFLSDNGGCGESVNPTPDIPPGPVGSYRTVEPPWANASNTPFRKFKQWNREGGISTPFIARGAGVTAEPGSFSAETGHIIDIMRSFVELTGAEYPESHHDEAVLPMEGTSLLPALKGKTVTRSNPIFWQVNSKRSRAVRMGPWKLYADNPEASWELYNLDSDRTELNNLSQADPGMANRLSGEFRNWLERCKKVSPSEV